MEKTLYEMEFDVEKMPLGMLSKAQIQKGYAVLSGENFLISLSVTLCRDSEAVG
jgi:hypothetical protein